MEILIIILIVVVIWYFNSDYRKASANNLSHSMGGGDVYLDPKISRDIDLRKKLDDASQLTKELSQAIKDEFGYVLSQKENMQMPKIMEEFQLYFDHNISTVNTYGEEYLLKQFINTKPNLSPNTIRLMIDSVTVDNLEDRMQKTISSFYSQPHVKEYLNRTGQVAPI